MTEKRNFTYILKCSDGTYYTGWTNDIEKRLKSHNSGKGCKYTRTRCPVTLVYLEESETKEAAMSREWHIKRLSREGKEKLISTFPGLWAVIGKEKSETTQQEVFKHVQKTDKCMPK